MYFNLSCEVCTSNRLRMLAGPAPKGKGKEKKEAGGRQTTLFGLPAVSAPEKEKKAPGRKKKANGAEESQASTTMSTSETQATDTTMVTEETADSQATEIIDEPMNMDSQVETQPIEEDDDEPIEWPDSPAAQTSKLVDVDA